MSLVLRDPPALLPLAPGVAVAEAVGAAGAAQVAQRRARRRAQGRRDPRRGPPAARAGPCSGSASTSPSTSPTLPADAARPRGDARSRTGRRRAVPGRGPGCSSSAALRSATHDAGAPERARRAAGPRDRVGRRPRVCGRHRRRRPARRRARWRRDDGARTPAKCICGRRPVRDSLRAMPAGQRGELRIGLTISGAIALGAFEGGALAALLTGVQGVNSRRGERDSLRVDVIAGASAGSMTGLLAARTLLAGLDPLKVMREAWVQMPQLGALEGHMDAPLAVDGMLELADRLLGSSGRRPRQAHPVSVHMALGSLHRLDYEIGRIAGPPVRAGTYLDWHEVRLGPRTGQTAYRDAMHAALASGAPRWRSARAGSNARRRPCGGAIAPTRRPTRPTARGTPTAGRSTTSRSAGPWTSRRPPTSAPKASAAGRACTCSSTRSAVPRAPRRPVDRATSRRAGRRPAPAC